ncbi:winged helix family two component transcriptional regulator [Tolypothrix tenuis PCC 7101]|uniref:Winged helix family two component transcriptional regulator n=1 Tax=Tolypothrix tenuis PCC 7101 TaxID=231146 RepID=A0A1Z4N4S0_9CYAN|nr:response regulator transcription factor [Aulosira sp. FACHB-113]BAZ00697.1 winged helix family two component transcriptional regulator [Tolypothrix tenuis PCC 7101]BAZ75380.1 winged helix family two component transcriptional regulator [Aulosira laxa NIES-50]
MRHILLVEDEVKLARFIELELNYEGYQVSIAYDGLTAITALQKLHLDLVILDLILPGVSGWEICRRLRSTDEQVPIIVLTPQDEASDRIEVLDAGANDYVVKPFSREELLFKVNTQLCKIKKPEVTEILKFEDISLNRRTREVYRGQRLLDLTDPEFNLLEYLLIHPRQIITRDRIIEDVWGKYFSGDANIIELYIRYLRLKLEANNEKRVLQTVHGIGYVLHD